MSGKEPLNETNESSKQIIDIMKSKPKKPDKVLIVGWIFFCIIVIYVLYGTYQSVAKMF